MPVLESKQRHDKAKRHASRPVPDNGQERLAALRQLLIIDMPPEERFDKIVQFAAGEFDMAIALLSLIDENRQ